MHPLVFLAILLVLLVGLLGYAVSPIYDYQQTLREYHQECDKVGGQVLRTTSRDGAQQLNCYTGVSLVKIKGD